MTICQTCKFCHIFFLEIQNKIKNFFFFLIFFLIKNLWRQPRHPKESIFFLFSHTKDDRSARAVLADDRKRVQAKRTLAILTAVVYLSKKYFSVGCAVHTFSGQAKHIKNCDRRETNERMWMEKRWRSERWRERHPII